MFKIDDQVQLIHGAKYLSGNAISDRYIDVELAIADIDKNNYVIKTVDGTIIGTVLAEFVEKFDGLNRNGIDPYYIYVKADNVAIYAKPNLEAEIIKIVPKYSSYKVVNQLDNWGKLNAGNGWIDLSSGVEVVKIK